GVGARATRGRVCARSMSPPWAGTARGPVPARPRQYVAARDAIWRGAQRRRSLDGFKSVYSIFVSRVDVYTATHVPTLSPRAQGEVGIVNAKRIWRMNQDFRAAKRRPLEQGIGLA